MQLESNINKATLNLIQYLNSIYNIIKKLKLRQIKKKGSHYKTYSKNYKIKIKNSIINLNVNTNQPV